MLGRQNSNTSNGSEAYTGKEKNFSMGAVAENAVNKLVDLVAYGTLAVGVLVGIDKVVELNMDRLARASAQYLEDDIDEAQESISEEVGPAIETVVDKRFPQSKPEATLDESTATGYCPLVLIECAEDTQG